MVKVNKVAHVVLNVKDPQASAQWYRDALGMEQVTFNPDAQMAFLSFGDQHHDIALMKAPEDAQHGQLGLNTSPSRSRAAKKSYAPCTAVS